MKIKKPAREYAEAFEWNQLTPVPVIGVDEAGRGCLAGRVYAAAVILNSTEDIHHYTDSKLLSESRREELFISITSHHQFSIAFATVPEINRLNIFWASMLAMKRAVLGLNSKGGHVLVDGNQKIPDITGFHQTTLVKGDLRAKPIAAASILAKVSRDRYVYELAKKFPLYQFEQHKGYATPLHKELIGRNGPCKEHRRFFAGVKEFWTDLKSESKSETKSERSGERP